ncbi:MAG: hypothetical protein ACRC78_01660 [Planktothrix sp.]
MNTTQIKQKVLAAIKEEAPSAEVNLFIKSFFDGLENKTNPLSLANSIGSLLRYKGKTLRILKLLVAYSPKKESVLFQNIEEILFARRVRKISPSTRPLRAILAAYFKYAEPDLIPFTKSVSKILVASKRPTAFKKIIVLSHPFLTSYSRFSTRGTTGVDLINSVLEGKPNLLRFSDASNYLIKEGLIDAAKVGFIK